MLSTGKHNFKFYYNNDIAKKSKVSFPQNCINGEYALI